MKKTIKIAHLYYDLLNLYGENGNIMALKKFIERQGIKTQIDNLSLGMDIDFKKYDFYYMGSGSEENEVLALGDLLKYRDDIGKAIEDGKMFLVTGNVMEIFGRKMERKDGDIKGLSLFGYNSKETETRNVGEIAYEFPELGKNKGFYIVGFKNSAINIVNNDYERPFGLQDNIRQNNFFAMNFFGPILIRNPYFTDYLLKILFESLDLDYKEDDSSSEYVAYREYVKNFIETHNLD